MKIIYTRFNHQIVTICVSRDIACYFVQVVLRNFSGYQNAMSWYEGALKEGLAFSHPCEWLPAAKDGGAISNPCVARAGVSGISSAVVSCGLPAKQYIPSAVVVLSSL